MSQFRSSNIYISGETKRALHLIAKMYPFPPTGSVMTVDEMGDRMLKDAIFTNYPEVTEHIKKVKELEDQLLRKDL